MKIADRHLSASPAAATASPGDCHVTDPTMGAGAYFRLKPWLDRALAALLLLPGLPLMGILILLVRLTSRGPGVYCQVRVGKSGKNFTMYKLRSMRLDAEAKSGPAWSASGADPRVTRLGYWLRRLH
ncbi:MAG TPA: sugar transferase, partial [Pirellulaceae bacterium]|nr:sugar transferase [Pirellulaceae bacterium]